MSKQDERTPPRSVASEATALVIGAGPVGLAMACELARHGVKTRLVEASLSPAQTSKALGVAARTLEVLTTMGAVGPFLEAGRHVHGASIYADGKRIVHVQTDDLDSPYPFTLVLPQADTERLLARHLTELGGSVERGTTLASFARE